MKLAIRSVMLIMLLVSLMLINVMLGQQFAVSGTYLNNTVKVGQPPQPGQAQGQAIWYFNVSFNSTGSSVSANISSGQVNYTDSLGRSITAAYPLQIYGTISGLKGSYYPINSALLVPVQIMSSYTTLGSVYQGSGILQNATAAPLCGYSRLYSEWDFYVHVQPNYTGGTKNVVVGRVCIYNRTIGWAEVLPRSPVINVFANLSLIANGQQENMLLPDNTSVVLSDDGLAEAWWSGKAGIVPQAADVPNGMEYAAIKSSSGKWYLQSSAAYMKWYTQYYKFLQSPSRVPSINQQYSPTSVGLVSSLCNVVSATYLTNQSVKSAVDCMNATASLYYSLANNQALQLVQSVQNMSGYQYGFENISTGPAVTLSLPGTFIRNPRMGFRLSGQFLGFSLPAAAPQILIANASPVSIDGAGTITMLVENYGNSQGLFTVSINGCPGVSAEPGISYSVGAGQVVNVTTSFTAPNGNLTLDKQCEVQITGSNGGGNAKNLTLVSETPNQYLHNSVQGLQDSVCNSDGVFTQLMCRYLGFGFS